MSWNSGSPIVDDTYTVVDFDGHEVYGGLTKAEAISLIERLLGGSHVVLEDIVLIRGGQVIEWNSEYRYTVVIQED